MSSVKMIHKPYVSVSVAFLDVPVNLHRANDPDRPARRAEVHAFGSTSKAMLMRRPGDTSGTVR
jgi:hypothetical protein